MKVISILATGLMLAGLTGCGPEIGEVFTINLNGSIVDSYGNPQVLTARSKVSLCAKVTLETYDSKGHNSSVSDKVSCHDLVTDQTGKYSMSAFETAPDQEYDIKSVSFYLKQYDSYTGYYYIVGNGKLDKMSLDMGKDDMGEYHINAKVDFDFNEVL